MKHSRFGYVLGLTPDNLIAFNPSYLCESDGSVKKYISKINQNVKFGKANLFLDKEAAKDWLKEIQATKHMKFYNEDIDALMENRTDEAFDLNNIKIMKCTIQIEADDGN